MASNCGKVGNGNGQNNVFQELATLCLKDPSTESVQTLVASLEDDKVKRLALTVFYHPLYDLTMKSLRFKSLAGDEEAAKSFGEKVANFEEQESALQSVFFGPSYESPICCYQRNSGSSKMDQLVSTLLDTVANFPKVLVPLTLEYLNAQQEFFIEHDRTKMGNSWLDETFKLYELSRGAFGNYLEDPRELEGENFQFWIPDLDENRVLCSKRAYDRAYLAAYDPQEETMKIHDARDASCVMKAFRRCTLDQTSQLLSRLYHGKDWVFQSNHMVFQEAFRPSYQIIKIDSRRVSYAAFHSAKGDSWHNRDEVMLKVDGVWTMCNSKVVPDSYHDCHMRRSKLTCNVSDEETGKAGCRRFEKTGLDGEEYSSVIINWPWLLSYKLGNEACVNLTANPPAFVYQNRSFAVKPVLWSWSSDGNALIAKEIGMCTHYKKIFSEYGPPRNVECGEEFGTASSALFLPHESQKMTKDVERVLSRTAQFPRRLIEIVKDFWHIEGLTWSNGLEKL